MAQINPANISQVSGTARPRRANYRLCNIWYFYLSLLNYSLDVIIENPVLFQKSYHVFHLFSNVSFLVFHLVSANITYWWGYSILFECRKNTLTASAYPISYIDWNIIQSFYLRLLFFQNKKIGVIHYDLRCNFCKLRI